MHTFFIPDNIRRMRLFDLRPSPELSSALRKMRIETFGDLGGVDLRHFQRVSKTGTTLFFEVGELIRRARQGHFVVPTAMRPKNRTSVVSLRHRSGAEKPGAVKNGNTTKPGSPHRKPALETIFIPEQARGRPVSSFRLSVRLQHVFGQKGFCLIGDLHGLAFSEFQKYSNCGRKSVNELRELVRALQRGEDIYRTERSAVQKAVPALVAGTLFVPSSVQVVSPFDLPLSVRLEGVLRHRKVSSLGDLHGIAVTDLRDTPNCGKKTIEELVGLIERVAKGEFKSQTESDVPWNPVELLRILDSLIALLPTREHEVLVFRFGGDGSSVLTLEEVGTKFGLTRERIRQISRLAVTRLQKGGSRRLRAYLTHLETICQDAVCPLTPDLLSHWISEEAQRCRFPMVFYVRLLGELSTGIPAWPHGQEPSSVVNDRHETVVGVVEDSLRAGLRSFSIQDAYAIARRRAKGVRLSAGEFLAAIKTTKRLRVQFEGPTEAQVKLPRLLAAEVARVVLRSSKSPLTPEDILAQARELFGNEIPAWNGRTLGNSLVEEKGFHLLGPRSYGLREHLLLPENLWGQARADFRDLLRQLNRPVSSAEAVNNHRFKWTEQTNAYELACILRGDDRLIDLGKFLFALAEWGIEEREYVKDLIPKVLIQAARPLTGTQVLERLRQLRSVSPTGIASLLRKHPDVRDYGFGHYGLKLWGDSVKGSIVTDPALVERVIRRAVPPLTFMRLCEILDISTVGALADNLWRTCSAFRDVLRLPEEQSHSTRLIHRSCRLERALVATAREINRPLPLHEFPWELNERFGPLFKGKSQEEMRRCLEQSPLFLRNATGQFILDIHLEQLGLDGHAIRRECAEILSQSNEIIGCEDLLERLEAGGKCWEELSPDILASLLRDDPTFQEIGCDRFRLKACKR
jgi:hypothetical protein